MDKTKEYFRMSDCPEIQDNWQPKVGDYVWRKYTVFGDKIDKGVWNDEELAEVVILHFKSAVDGYFAATNGKGEEQIFNSIKELHKATCIWLPTQSDLQEMTEVKAVSSEPQYKVMSQFVRFFDHYEWVPPHFTTWEQLWLAFVMKEKYNKVWTGGKWVKQAKRK